MFICKSFRNRYKNEPLACFKAIPNTNKFHFHRMSSQKLAFTNLSSLIVVLALSNNQYYCEHMLRYTPPLPTSVQPISITKTLLIVPAKNERDPPLFTGKLLIKFQNILRNTTQVIIRHRVKILFSVISSPITGTAKVKIVKNERDPLLFTGKLLIKFQNILRNTTQKNHVQFDE